MRTIELNTPIFIIIIIIHAEKSRLFKNFIETPSFHNKFVTWNISRKISMFIRSFKRIKEQTKRKTRGKTHV